MEDKPSSVIQVDVEQPVYNDECVICFDEIQKLKEEGKNIIIFSCNHQLCYECAELYICDSLKNGVDIKCPVCRDVLCDSNTHLYQAARETYLEMYPLDYEQVHQEQIRQIRPPNWIHQTLDIRDHYQTPSNRWLYSIPCTLILFMVTFMTLIFANIIKIN